MNRTATEDIKQKFAGDILDVRQHNEQRNTLNIKPEALLKISNELYSEKKYRFIIASGLHSMNGFEIYYHFSNDQSGEIINLHVLLPDKDPEIGSLTGLFSASEWIEREMHELLGINFKGHPNLVPLLSEGNWPKGTYPYRKEF
ncbi:MAG: NADH-quinone oxidoreductase subunit C [Bacteroidales bacterium]|nr:NADH-quinone oxidoreductase subunit C [Bacteroidales bacterium]